MCKVNELNQLPRWKYRGAFDKHLSFDKYVTNLYKTCFYYLRDIARIRSYLWPSNTETLVQAFISSKLDNCNLLLYGLPTFLIDRLQNVQNCAARLVTRPYHASHEAIALAVSRS